MPPIISQDELDTLLTSIAVAGRRRRPTAGAVTAALYDFRWAAKLSPDHLRLMQGRLAGLAGVLNRTMGLYLNSEARFGVHSLDVTSYEQVLRNLAVQPILGAVTFEGSPSPALWEISAPVAGAALECMLGHAGAAEDRGNSEPTPIERRILRRLFQEIITSWTELWDRLRSLRPQVDAVVTSHTAVDLRSLDERMFSAVLECSIAGVAGMVRLCMPLGVVKRLLRDEREVVNALEASEHADMIPAAQPLATTTVPVRVQLEPPPVPLAELGQLAPGSVLNLRMPATGEFVVLVGEVAKFGGAAGSANGRLAVRLISEADPPPDA